MYNTNFLARNLRAASLGRDNDTIIRLHETDTTISFKDFFQNSERIASALLEGASARSVAKRFGVSAATAIRLGQVLRSGGDLGPRKMGGYRGFVLSAPVVTWLGSRLAEQNDLTVRALTAELAAEHGIVVSHDTVWRCIRRLGLSSKKNTAGKRAGWSEDSPAAGSLEDPSA